MEEMRGQLIRRQIFMADDETDADLFYAANPWPCSLKTNQCAVARIVKMLLIGKYFIAAGQAALRCLVAAAPVSCAAPCALTAVWQV